MSDPLSVTAGVVGIVAFALQSCQLLSRSISDIRDAPKDLQSIRSDLQVVEPLLRQLDVELQGNASPLVLSHEIELVVKNCGGACDQFNEALKGWTRHSTAERTTWRDSTIIGLFRQGDIKTLKGHLEVCKNSLSVTLSAASLLVPLNDGND